MSTLLHLHLTPLICQCAASIRCVQSDDCVSQTLAIECCPTNTPPSPPSPSSLPFPHPGPHPHSHLPGASSCEIQQAAQLWSRRRGPSGYWAGASVLLLPPLPSLPPSHGVPPPPFFPGLFPLDSGARCWRGRRRCGPGAAGVADPVGPGAGGRDKNT